MSKKKMRQLCIYGLLMILFCTTGLMLEKRHANAATNQKYVIKVNKQQNCVTVYEKDSKGKFTKPVRAMVCSAGWATPVGTYNTKAKYRWKILLDNVWGQYSTRIVDGILFHSVWYYKQDPSTLSEKQYNNLGITCSHGCVRLTVEDAKWIYDNCGLGTKVIIYNSSDPGPLGKPKAQKITLGTGWDPTDPDKNNPYLKQKPPVIKGAKDRTIAWGSKFDAKKGVTAKSSDGKELTSSIKVEGNVDTSKAGKYKITYCVQDSLKKETKVDVTITVKKCPYKVNINGTKDHVISAKQKVSRSYVLKGVSATFNSKKLKQSEIKTKIKETKYGYSVTYSVNVSEGQSSKVTSKYYVDTKAPVITAKNAVYDSNEEMNFDFAMQFVKVEDNYTKMTEEYIDVDFEEIDGIGYEVTYYATDEVGNTSSKTIRLIYHTSLSIHGVKDQTVPIDTEVNIDYVMQDVTGEENGEDVTDRIQVSILKTKDGGYEVTYRLVGTTGEEVEKTAIYTVERTEETEI